MKILVISQYYAPEPVIIDKICEGLVDRGHDVTVLTGTPNYPKGVVYAGYEKGQRKDEVVGGVKIHRCFEIARKKGVIYRALNYYSFVASSKKYVKRLENDYDVVLAYQPSPVLQAKAAFTYQKKTGVPVVLYCLDLWPESLTIGKVCKKSLLYKHFFRVSKKIYTKANKILVSSRLFAPRMQENFGIDKDDVVYLPQHADTIFAVEACKKQEDGYFDFLFAGNVGLAQSAETIVYAAKQLQDQANIRFHIVGEGTSLEKVKELAQKLGETNVFFYGKRPMEEMPAFYAKADAMLITFAKDEVLSMTVPLKTQSYMAAGKPILCAADGAVAEEVKTASCGYVSPAQDATALKENVLRFVFNTAEERAKMGNNARAHFEAHFTKDKFLDGLEKALSEAAKKGKV